MVTQGNYVTHYADLLVIHAGELVTARADERGARGRGLERLEVVEDGAVAVVDGRIVDVGPTSEVLPRFPSATEVLDVGGRLVTPAFVDPHTHLVYAGSRHLDWEARVTERPAQGLEGGIRFSVERTRAAGEEELCAQALRDLDVMLAHGTTAVEAKTGYGLDRDTELRLLRVLASLEHAVEVHSTYLGAHVLPAEYEGRRSEYVDLVIATLPEARRYADCCDVCCDPVGFTLEECRRIIASAHELGFDIRIHADQTGNAGGGRLGAEVSALSADHLDYIDEEAMAALAASGCVGVLLPAVTHHMLEMTPPADGRSTAAEKGFWPSHVCRMIEAGMLLALSTDFNPGTAPCRSMQETLRLAARLFRLSYAACWHMATINAAHALGQGDERGSLESGKRADLLVWHVTEHGMAINQFGTNLVDAVVAGGRLVVGDGHLLRG